MLIIIVCLLMIDGARDTQRERWQSQTQGERRDQWSSSSEKSGSYGLERALRSEEPVRKNKGGPWRMVGDGAIVVYRQLIINPGQNDPSGWHRDSRAIAATVRALTWVREEGPGPSLLISSALRHLKSSNLETFHQHPSPALAMTVGDHSALCTLFVFNSYSINTA